MKVNDGLFDFPFNHAHSVGVKLRNLFIKVEPKLVVVRLREGEVMEGLDVFVEQSTVMSVDRAHTVRRIQRCNNDHDGKRQESDKDFGTNFQVCYQTHVDGPPLCRSRHPSKERTLEVYSESSESENCDICQSSRRKYL